MGKKSDAIIDRDISLWQVYSSGAELLFGGVPLQLTIPPWTPTCASQTHTTHLFPNCSAWKGCPLWKEWNSISDLSLDDRIYSALQFLPKHRCQNTFLEVIGRTDKGEGYRERGQTEGGRWSTFSPLSHEFLWSRQMLPHIFLQSWQVAYCFPW